MNVMTMFRTRAIGTERTVQQPILLRCQHHPGPAFGQMTVVAACLALFQLTVLAQRWFEFSSLEEFETSFEECGRSTYQQYTYSDGPGMGGLPGRVEAGGDYLKVLFYRQPFVLEVGESLSASVCFKYVQESWHPGRQGSELVTIRFADATAYGQQWLTNYGFVQSAVVVGVGGEARQLGLAANLNASSSGPDAITDYSANFSLTPGWYELAALCTLLETNLLEVTAVLYSHGQNGTGPTYQLSRHTIRFANFALGVSKPVFLGATGVWEDVPYLDNFSIASEPSAPILREVQIDSLRGDGWLTWRTTVLPGFYGIECAQDPGGAWRPSAFWNAPTSGSKTSVQIPLRQGSAPKLFFRVVCSQPELPLPRGAGAWEARTDRGLVRGKVTFWEGDFMPPGTGTIVPASRPIFVFEKAKLAQTVQSLSGGRFYSFVLTPFVDSVESGADGSYEIALPPGDYSLFVLEPGGGFWTNESDGVGHLNPVTVQANQTIVKDIDITYKAAF